LPVRPDSARSARLVFWLQLVLGAVGVAAATAAVLTAAGSVHRSARGTHDVMIAGQAFTYPAVNAAAAILLALAALGAAVLATVVRGALGQLRAHRRLVHGIPVLGPLPGHPSVRVIDESSPQAFCAGYFRPSVYVSRGALELLSEAELAAVLSHEDRHRSTRDPLRFACARVLSRALFFLPALRPLSDRYEELAEQRADAAAVRARAGDRSALAAAMLAFDAATPPGAAGISNERVDALLGEPSRWRLPSPLIALSLATLSGFVVLVWRASGAASAHATFNLPVLSSQPCMLVLALLPAVVIVAALSWRRRAATTLRAGSAATAH
jgi:Zn-dependent protease with chaperone function